MSDYLSDILFAPLANITGADETNDNEPSAKESGSIFDDFIIKFPRSWMWKPEELNIDIA